MPPPLTVPTPGPSEPPPTPRLQGREEERTGEAASGSSSEEGAVDEGFAACV